MMALWATLAWGAPPAGAEGLWRLVRVESPQGSWNFEDKAAGWRRQGDQRCTEIGREVLLEGDDVELVRRWTCDEPGFGAVETERRVRVEAQWNGAELIVPTASGEGRFVEVKPPDAAQGRGMVALVMGATLGGTLGPLTWTVAVEPAARGGGRLRLARSDGEVWLLAPVGR